MGATDTYALRQFEPDGTATRVVRWEVAPQAFTDAHFRQVADRVPQMASALAEIREHVALSRGEGTFVLPGVPDVPVRMHATEAGRRPPGLRQLGARQCSGRSAAPAEVILYL